MAPTTYTPPINTYVPLESIVLTNAASSVTFFNIAQGDDNGTYKDLILVIDGAASSGQDILIKLNEDAANYTRVYAYGTGSVTNSGSASSNGWGVVRTAQSNTVLQIMDYSATDKHKTILSRLNGASDYGTAMMAGRWASTSAVISINAYVASGTFAIGSTFSLYGIHG